MIIEIPNSAVPTPESSHEENAEAVIEDVIERLKNRLEEKFAGYKFHKPSHSIEQVAKGTLGVLDMAKNSGMTIPDFDKKLGTIVAYAHDQVMNAMQPIIPDFNTRTSLNKMGYTVKRFRGSTPDELTNVLLKSNILKDVRVTDEQGVEKKEIVPDEDINSIPITEGNEAASFSLLEEVIEEVAKENPEAEAVFTADVRNRLKEAIAVTYPDFAFEALPSEEGGAMALNIFQPHLKETKDILALATALGDLFYMGRMSFDNFVKISNGEFAETHELHLALLKQFKELENKEGELTTDEQKLKAQMPKMKQEIAEEMLAWLRDQVGVLRWQRVNFNTLLNKHRLIKDNPQFKILLKNHYRYFGPDENDNIVKSEARYAAFQKKFAAIGTDPTALDQFLDEIREELDSGE